MKHNLFGIELTKKPSAEVEALWKSHGTNGGAIISQPIRLYSGWSLSGRVYSAEAGALINEAIVKAGELDDKKEKKS